MEIDKHTPFEIAEDFANLALLSEHERDVNGDKGANIVDALFAISRSLHEVARAIIDLGNAGAVTHNGTNMGAIEAFGLVVKEGLSEMVIAVESGLQGIGDSISGLNTKKDN